MDILLPHITEHIVDVFRKDDLTTEEMTGRFEQYLSIKYTEVNVVA